MVDYVIVLFPRRKVPNGGTIFKVNDKPYVNKSPWLPWRIFAFHWWRSRRERDDDSSSFLTFNMPANACNYQHICRRISNYCLRRKWIVLSALTSCAVLLIYLTRHSFIEYNTTIRDTYLDDVPVDLYQTGGNFLQLYIFSCKEIIFYFI